MRALLDAGALAHVIGFDRDLDALARRAKTLATLGRPRQLVHADTAPSTRSRRAAEYRPRPTALWRTSAFLDAFDAPAALSASSRRASR